MDESVPVVLMDAAEGRLDGPLDVINAIARTIANVTMILFIFVPPTL
jgi:hypothetical protein